MRLFPTLWNPQGSPSSDPAYGRPTFPPGEGIGKACMAYVENYRSNPPNVP